MLDVAQRVRIGRTMGRIFLLLFWVLGLARRCLDGLDPGRTPDGLARHNMVDVDNDVSSGEDPVFTFVVTLSEVQCVDPLPHQACSSARGSCFLGNCVLCLAECTFYLCHFGCMWVRPLLVLLMLTCSSNIPLPKGDHLFKSTGIEPVALYCQWSNAAGFL